MYGALLGDMIGSPYEFDRGNKTKDFPLFCRSSRFTDDSVMTIAVAEALLDHPGQENEAIRAALIRSMRKWGRRYPDAGYGRRFYDWLWSKRSEPYGSYGNGSAMRVSSVGWLFDTLEQTRHAARLTAEVTHNHPEGIKGAEAIASAIYLARTGRGKEEIKAYIQREFGYDLSRSCDQIRPGYTHIESCQKTVPEAITAFLEGTDFEDVIRTAVSLGGDCDTLTCIAGSMAEAFYGVPEELKRACESRLPEDMRDVLGRFEIARRHGSALFPADLLSGNAVIEEAGARFRREGSGESFAGLIGAIRERMRANGHLLIPVSLPDAAPEGDKAGQSDLCRELRLIRAKDGSLWLAAFTSEEEFRKGEAVPVISYFIDAFLESVRDAPAAGIVLNVWGEAIWLPKELIGRILCSEEEPSP